MHTADRTLGDHVSANENHNDVVRSSLHDAARAYAAHGVAIFPCQVRGKKPLLRRCEDAIDGEGLNLTGHRLAEHAAHCPGDGHGFHDATTNLETIDRWWGDQPDANIGIALGANGMFAVDVDGPEGRATLDQLEAAHGPIPETYQVVTGRTEGSGRHHVFTQPDDGAPVGNHKLGDHLETRGDGGYIIAPPSIHPSGRAYMAMGRWTEIAAPPAWLVAAARPTDTHSTPATVSAAGTDQLALRRLDAACGKVAMAAEGDRNNTLNWAAYRAGQIVGAGALDLDLAADRLMTAALRAGLAPSESQATIVSGLSAGRQDPDHTPQAAYETPTPTVLHTDLTDPVPDAPDVTSGSWQVADAAAILDGTYTQPETAVLTRDDGVSLLYPGATNAIFGESESGKSWLALHACCQQILAGHHALYIDFEATAPVIILRLAALGAPPDAIINRFHYIAPDGPVDQAATDTLRQLVATHQPTLAVIDGVTGAMGIHGWDPLSNSDTEQFDRLLPRPLAATGAAVVTVDHVPKSRDADAKYAIGGQHKRAAISGAAYRVDVLTPLAPGAHGRLKITISKDRHGTVRAAHPTQAGIFHLDSTDPDQPRATITAPDAPREGQEVRPTYLMEQVSRCLETSPDELNQREVLALVDGKTQYVRKALALLVEEGFVAQRLAGQKHLHSSVRAYRDEEKKP